MVVRASASQSVNLGFIFQVESLQKTLKNSIHSSSLLGIYHNGWIVWTTSRQACLLCPWASHLTGCLCFHVVERWWGQEVYPLWWPSLTEDSQTEHEVSGNVCTASCIMLRTNSLNQGFPNFFARDLF